MFKFHRLIFTLIFLFGSEFSSAVSIRCEESLAKYCGLDFGCITATAKKTFLFSANFIRGSEARELDADLIICQDADCNNRDIKFLETPRFIRARDINNDYFFIIDKRDNRFTQIALIDVDANYTTGTCK